MLFDSNNPKAGKIISAFVFNLCKFLGKFVDDLHHNRIVIGFLKELNTLMGMLYGN